MEKRPSAKPGRGVAVERGELAASLSDGSVLQFTHHYEITYPEDKRLITPSLKFPKGEAPVAFMPQAAQGLVVRDSGDSAVLFGVDATKTIYMKAFETETNMLSGESTLSVNVEVVFELGR